MPPESGRRASADSPAEGSPRRGAPPPEEGASRAIRAFYQAHPFPAFDPRDFSGFEGLKGRASAYVRLLDQSIGSRARVLEVGCGTGQLINYLAHIPTRRLVGVDFSRASLVLAARLRDRLGFDNLRLLEADLFGLPLDDGAFDCVLCHGVLHHTPDPAEGLRRVVRALRPGGGIVVGLYHRLGRRRHWRQARRIRQGRASRGVEGGGWGDAAAAAGAGEGGTPGTAAGTFRYRPSTGGENPTTAASWFADAYLNPYETGHLLGEAAGWFRGAGVTITGSAPSFEWGAGMWNDRPLFDGTGPSRWHRNRLTFLVNDLMWWIRPVERGYFLLFGRKE